jgi:hypothetical protein
LNALFLVQWLLKMELWSCYWRRSTTVSPFVSLFCSFVPCLCVSPCVVFLSSLSTGFPVRVLSGFFCLTPSFVHGPSI